MHTLKSLNTNRAVPTAADGQTLTVRHALQYFALSLKKPNNYLRIVRRYLEYYIEYQSTIDQVSFSLYTTGQRPSLISPVRKFVRFAAEHQIIRVVADPERGPRATSCQCIDTSVPVRGQPEEGKQSDLYEIFECIFHIHGSRTSQWRASQLLAHHRPEVHRAYEGGANITFHCPGAAFCDKGLGPLGGESSRSTVDAASAGC